MPANRIPAPGHTAESGDIAGLSGQPAALPAKQKKSTTMPNKKQSTPRISPSIRRKMLLLLDMEYKPSEIANEIGVHRQTVMSYLKFGLPARRDEHGSIWINGVTFCGWAKRTLSTHASRKLVDEKEFYCLTCKVVFWMETFTRQRMNKSDYLRATCPKCGRIMGKFAKAKNDTA
jgi:hypothetical protein